MSGQNELPSLFIASSRERLKVARAVQEELERDARCVVWSQAVFRASERSVDSLVRMASESDFGLFVFHPDDFATIRGTTTPVPRDNVVFELGLFIGALGPERCFILLPRGVNLHLPSDLVGVNPIDYEGSHVDQNPVAAIGAACNKVRRELERLKSTQRKRAAEAQDADDAREWEQVFQALSRIVVDCKGLFETLSGQGGPVKEMLMQQPALNGMEKAPCSFVLTCVVASLLNGLKYTGTRDELDMWVYLHVVPHLRLFDLVEDPPAKPEMPWEGVKFSARGRNYHRWFLAQEGGPRLACAFLLAGVPFPR